MMRHPIFYGDTWSRILGRLDRMGQSRLRICGGQVDLTKEIDGRHFGYRVLVS
jgi:hypothetical protein